MGLIHIYCGDGKGKTTSALGLALRAVGSGMRVHIVQFLKGNETSELVALRQLENISIERCDRNYGFTFSMSSEDKFQLVQCHNRLLNHAIELVSTQAIDLLILDEFNVAYEKQLLDVTLADSLIFNKPDYLELVLTGRNPQSKFISVADYVSEIHAVKHPFSKGIQARKGIEY
jgi:cob(I)alamin adenosyltransferase